MFAGEEQDRTEPLPEEVTGLLERLVGGQGPSGDGQLAGEPAVRARREAFVRQVQGRVHAHRVAEPGDGQAPGSLGDARQPFSRGGREQCGEVLQGAVERVGGERGIDALVRGGVGDVEKLVERQPLELVGEGRLRLGVVEPVAVTVRGVFERFETVTAGTDDRAGSQDGPPVAMRRRSVGLHGSVTAVSAWDVTSFWRNPSSGLEASASGALGRPSGEVARDDRPSFPRRTPWPSPDRIGGDRDRGVDEDGVAAELHGLGGMRRRAEAGVDDDGNGGLFDDDPDGVARADALVRADPRAERHDRRAPHLLQALGEDGVGADVRQHGEPVVGERLGGRERLDRVGQEVAGLGRDLELDPRGEPGGSGQARDPDGLVGVDRAGRVRQDQVARLGR